MDINFFYCERNNLELLAEPLNLFTNILFLFFSILLYFDKTVKNKIFAFILFGIGIGSMLYHSFATRFTALVDILFIKSKTLFVVLFHTIYHFLFLSKYTQYLY